MLCPMKAKLKAHEAKGIKQFRQNKQRSISLKRKSQFWDQSQFSVTKSLKSDDINSNR